ncbi:hypothetical protein Cgig2_007059 [Carnegiea gigantea]|uniref:Glucan endo-1,3-beta-D-glucosidase n=1 Tax=Carnegiea gigantea TaxID=171969 RepID=A0A9Q1QEV0_9CARY|nr:hypothetical protein Cgig2_007059 [Carnegiea gigantea]
MGIRFTLFLLLCLLLFFSSSTADGAPVGICYGRVADNLPPPATVVSLLQSNAIPMVRIFKPDPEVLRSFSGSGIDLMVGVPNEILPALANASIDFCLQWLQANIFSHIPPTQIKYLAVGNEVFSKDPYFTPFVVPSILNFHQALRSINLDQLIKISTPHAASVLSGPYPPSNGSFSSDIRQEMVPLLQFLQDTDSPFMVNVYPFFSYINNKNDIELDYVLFRTPNVTFDDGLIYDNLFDATLDSFVAAMEKEGFGWVRLMVSETGWPTTGGEAAGMENASAYNGNVVSRALGNIGTPRRPGVEVEVFLFDLFDENGKNGDEYEKHFGVFRLNGDKAYDVSFTLP